ncbi:MAG: hypothetical protein WB784_01260 [Rhodanobacteraceae bacterium]
MELKDRPAEQPKGEGRSIAARHRWFHRETISLAEIAVQVFSVVLGILLAFGIGNWSESRESARKVAEARTAIRAEIEANRDRLRQTAVYQANLARTVTAAVDSPAPPGRCTEVAGWRGLQTVLLLHSAYDNAIAAGVFTNMALANGQAIATIYALQERYLLYSNKSLDWLALKFMNEGEAAGCAGVVEDLARAGRNLLKNYDDYLSPLSAAVAGSRSTATP